MVGRAHTDQHTWALGDTEAFRCFGGVPGRPVPDNLKTKGDKPGRLPPADSTSRTPKSLPVRDSFWSGWTFIPLERMPAEALLCATNVAVSAPVRPLDGAKPLSVVEAVEAESLLPAAGRAVRAGQMVVGDGRPGQPRQGRPYSLHGALRTGRTPRRRPLRRVTVQTFHGGRAGQDASGLVTDRTARHWAPAGTQPERVPDPSVPTLSPWDTHSRSSSLRPAARSA
jgi:hypothetical protein